MDHPRIRAIAKRRGPRGPCSPTSASPADEASTTFCRSCRLKRLARTRVRCGAACLRCMTTVALILPGNTKTGPGHRERVCGPVHKHAFRQRPHFGMCGKPGSRPARSSTHTGSAARGRMAAGLCGVERHTQRTWQPPEGTAVGLARALGPGRPGASTCERAPGHYGFSEG